VVTVSNAFGHGPNIDWDAPRCYKFEYNFPIRPPRECFTYIDKHVLTCVQLFTFINITIPSYAGVFDREKVDEVCFVFLVND